MNNISSTVVMLAVSIALDFIMVRVAAIDRSLGRIADALEGKVDDEG